MPWRIIYGLVALFVLTNAQQSGRRLRWDEAPKETSSDNLIDIDVETERNNALDQGLGDYQEVSGSGSGVEDADDEDLVTSGSGSGVGIPLEPDGDKEDPDTKPTIVSNLSPCEQLRDASKHLLGNYVPRCTDDGHYDSLQCRGHPGTGLCWCADLGGREIPGTAFDGSKVPDCKEGNNLPPCVFKLIQQSRTGLLGVFRPVCTLQGDFEAKQCSGSMCYCVNPKSGVKKPGTEKFLPDDPNCHGEPVTVKQQGGKVEKATTLAPREKTAAPTTININIDNEDEDEEESDKTKEKETSNETDSQEAKRELSSAANVMTQPGILAAIIGGSVVLLLCAILLVMFIVYRMRKKDEGSYALDEPKKMPNYSYQRAPDKEFYA